MVRKKMIFNGLLGAVLVGAATVMVGNESLAGDEKYYTVADGKIDENTVKGWQVFRGQGTCGACHGGAAQGGAGPSLVKSVQGGLTKEKFTDIVTNGKEGTLMKSFSGNSAVMENIDNIYAYIQARADDVVGDKSLKKYPLGKE